MQRKQTRGAFFSSFFFYSRCNPGMRAAHKLREQYAGTAGNNTQRAKLKLAVKSYMLITLRVLASPKSWLATSITIKRAENG